MDQHVIKLWNAFTGECIITWEINCQCGFNSLVFSPDDSAVLAPTGHVTASVWDARTGKRMKWLRGGHSHGILFAGFSANGSSIITAAVDGTAKVWSAASGKPTV